MLVFSSIKNSSRRNAIHLDSLDDIIPLGEERRSVGCRFIRLQMVHRFSYPTLRVSPDIYGFKSHRRKTH